MTRVFNKNLIKGADGKLIIKVERVGLKTHGKCKSPEYQIWAAIKKRCNNPNNKQFHDYGGRGIDICGEWLFFENFIKDMGKRPSKEFVIDRVDNSRGYSKENCKWVTRKESSSNRRSCRGHTLNGKSFKTIVELAAYLGVDKDMLRCRLNKGLSVEEASTKPNRYKNRRSPICP